jgi:hypothetical protein
VNDIVNRLRYSGITSPEVALLEEAASKIESLTDDLNKLSAVISKLYKWESKTTDEILKAFK